MSSKSRLSIGSQNDKLLKTQWECLEEMVRTAELHLRNLNLKTAQELCNKALSILPDFYPAVQLKKKIDQKILTCAKETSSSDSFDDSESDGASCGGRLATADAGSTPARRKFGGTVLAQQTESASSRQDELPYQKSCLKQTQTSAPTATAAHSSRGHQQQENSGKGLTWAVDPNRPLSERRLKNLLLEGVFFLATPVEMYHRLRQLWHPDSLAYGCPRPSCGFKFDRRLDAVEHFINRHFQETDEGQAVTPFGCKTCQKRFISADLLLSHAAIYHPTCHWAGPLKEVLQREEY